MNKVKVYNPITETVTEIPSAELAPGMIKVYIPSIGEAYEKAHQNKLNTEKKHKKLNPDCDKAASITYEILKEVLHVKSFNEWRDGFLKDLHPKRELMIWLNISGTYEYFTKGKKLRGEEKREIYNLTTTCSNSDRSDVLNIFNCKCLSKARAKTIRDRYYKFDLEERFGNDLDPNKMD